MIRARRALKIAIGSRLSAANGDLELSVAVMSLALEMPVECLFGDDGGQPSSAAVTTDLASYGLTKSQKKPIKQALREAIVVNVDKDSDYHRDIEVIIGRLFWRTAADKIGQMLGHYNIAFDADDLQRFINVRNSVIHGTPMKYELRDRVNAMLFGQAMLSQWVLRELGWTGGIYDERSARLAERDLPGETPPTGDVQG
jgi:hypothetical protein